MRTKLDKFLVFDEVEEEKVGVEDLIADYQLQNNEVYIVYKTTNLINNKIYVGQHLIKDITTSAKDHYLGSGLWLIRAINKYGEENFSREILDTSFSRKEISEKEIYWISQLSATHPEIGYNIALGGDGGNFIPWTPERCQKISKSNKGKCKGKNNGMYGKKHSEVARKRMSENHPDMSGNKNPNFGNHKLAGIPKGPMKDETKQKISSTKKKNPIKFSKEEKERRSQFVKGTIRIYNPKLDIEKIWNKNDLIPEGFIKGRRPVTTEQKLSMSKSASNRIWITNIELNCETLIKKSDSIPNGWIVGRLKKRKNV